MYAYIETSGKQLKVTEGAIIKAPRIQGEPGAEVSLGKVLAVVGENGKVFGTPYVENASVTAEIIGEGRDGKVIVFKKLPRKNHRKSRGHRQHYTTLKVKSINAG